MEKKAWKVDISRFIEVVADRMYSDPLRAGLREIITNSLDAREGTVNIEISIHDGKLEYSDNGTGINPKEFSHIYGKIAAGSKRKKGARGIFGIGRMALIALSKQGIIKSFYKGKCYLWKFDKKGWLGPETKNLSGKGIYLAFSGLHFNDLLEIENWLRRTFAIPLEKRECILIFNGSILSSPLTEFTLMGPVLTRYGDFKIYKKEEMDGILSICQNGILVKEDSYTGLSAYVDQDFLEIKTDREGFINNTKYRLFNKRIKKELASLRPQKSFEKMEVDFIQRLMKGFKRYWTKKASRNHVLENLEIKFPEEGKEIIPEPMEDPIPSDPIEIPEPILSPEVPETSVETPSGTTEVKIEIPELTKEEIEQEEAIRQIVEIGEQITESQSEPEEKIEPQEIPEKKVVVIRGAKPVDLGEDYPVIFFEKEPFVLVFNTSHPIFKKLVERGKLGSQELAVLFERMFECAYADKNPSESLDIIKKRWKEVDNKLKSLF